VAENLTIVVHKHQIRYLQPAFFNNEMEISTWVSSIRNTSGARHFTVTRPKDKTAIANINTVYVWVSLTSGRLTRIPQNLLDDFAPNIAGN